MPQPQDTVCFWIPEESDRQLVFGFFVVFSRFEYALKRGGYLKKDRHNNALPNWKTFANDIKGSFQQIDGADFKAAVEYFSEYPPQRQQVGSGEHLYWEPQQETADDHCEGYILRLVKTVRNNLFHGGKQPYEQGRDGKLVEHACTILLACVELQKKVNKYFYSSPD